MALFLVMRGNPLDQCQQFLILPAPKRPLYLSATISTTQLWSQSATQVLKFMISHVCPWLQLKHAIPLKKTTITPTIVSRIYLKLHLLSIFNKMFWWIPSCLKPKSWFWSKALIVIIYLLSMINYCLQAYHNLINAWPCIWTRRHLQTFPRIWVFIEWPKTFSEKKLFCRRCCSIMIPYQISPVLATSNLNPWHHIRAWLME